MKDPLSPQTLWIVCGLYVKYSKAEIDLPHVVRAVPNGASIIDDTNGIDAGAEYLYVEGQVTDTDGKPLKDVLVETWETDDEGWCLPLASLIRLAVLTSDMCLQASMISNTTFEINLMEEVASVQIPLGTSFSVVWFHLHILSPNAWVLPLSLLHHILMSDMCTHLLSHFTDDNNRAL